jgi:hypothetical protein
VLAAAGVAVQRELTFMRDARGEWPLLTALIRQVLGLNSIWICFVLNESPDGWSAYVLVLFFDDAGLLAYPFKLTVVTAGAIFSSNLCF